MNDSLYCYYIKSKGFFSAPHLNYFTNNLSEISCAIPHDTTAPCITELTISNDCQNATSPIVDAFIQNHLSWKNPNTLCGTDDGKKYYIYYSTTDSFPLQKIDSVSSITNPTYLHSFNNSVAGCYAITSIDSAGNESKFSNIVCMDNCPVYVLPNVFSPNGDGKNDLFHPFLPYRFIDHVEMKIYNKWGSEVFNTQDANISWNGTFNGKELETASYYYVCYVFEIRVSGIVKNKTPLTGFIELIR
jgi:gliding motility-associated-like protein